MVVKINENYQKLKSSYLFVEVARREAEFVKAHPDADIIKMGIGDVTKPLVPAVVKAFKNAVDENRCHIIQADVSNMPIEDETYDLVSAFETIYFWPDIENTFKEVSRIIKQNGQFMIAQGTDGNHPDDEKWLNTIEGMSVYTAPQLEQYLINAGFKNVNYYKKENDYILVVIAQK